MDISIRKYNEQDKEFLLDVANKLHEFAISLDPIKRLRKMPGYAEHAVNELLITIEKQEGKIFIAEVNSTPVGLIAGFTTQQSKINLLSVIPTKLGVISDVYVDEKFRGQQIGSKLMKVMEDYLKDKGCDS